VFGLGIVLCRVRVDTGSVWWATAVHALWNFVTIGAVAWAPSPESAVLPAVGALKLAGIVAGLVLAIRFGVRSRRARHVPPMPTTLPTGAVGPAPLPHALSASLPPPPVP
jgi:cytochrome b561